MRQMKFRAWHKTLKRWLSYEEFYIDGTGRIFTTQYSEMGEPHTDISDDVELVQFTGLLDKNGKEIYEGDVCEQKRGYWKGLGYVAYRDGMFCFYRNMGGNEELCIAIQNEELMVVGNIFENPNLLNKI